MNNCVEPSNLGTFNNSQKDPPKEQTLVCVSYTPVKVERLIPPHWYLKLLLVESSLFPVNWVPSVKMIIGRVCKRSAASRNGLTHRHELSPFGRVLGKVTSCTCLLTGIRNLCYSSGFGIRCQARQFVRLIKAGLLRQVCRGSGGCRGHLCQL